MKIFISGGCKNGKSTNAQIIAKKMQNNSEPLYYIATMVPIDSEDQNRILRHQEERKDLGFKTVEVARDINKAIAKCNFKGTFLLDSVTALLMNEMFRNNGTTITDAYKKVAHDLKECINEVQNIVVVSDYIYSDAIKYDKFTELYKMGLAYIDKKIAKNCDIVLEAFSGRLFTYKGAELFEEFYNELV